MVWLTVRVFFSIEMNGRKGGLHMHACISVFVWLPTVALRSLAGGWSTDSWIHSVVVDCLAHGNHSKYYTSCLVSLHWNARERERERERRFGANSVCFLGLEWRWRCYKNNITKQTCTIIFLLFSIVGRFGGREKGRRKVKQNERIFFPHRTPRQAIQMSPLSQRYKKKRRAKQ